MAMTYRRFRSLRPSTRCDEESVIEAAD